MLGRAAFVICQKVWKVDVIGLCLILGIMLVCCGQGDLAEIFPFDEVRTELIALPQMYLTCWETRPGGRAQSPMEPV